MWGPLCSSSGVGRRASREGVCCVPVFWEKDSAHSCAQGVNAKQTCLTHAPSSAVMALLSKIPPPPHTHTHWTVPLPLLTSTMSTRPKLQHLNCRDRGTVAQLTQEGFLIKGCGRQYCVSGWTGACVIFRVDCFSAYWVAQVYTLHMVFLFSDDVEHMILPTSYKNTSSSCMLQFPSLSNDVTVHLSHFLILLKSGNQYQSKYIINMCAVMCMYIFCVHAGWIEVS